MKNGTRAAIWNGGVGLFLAAVVLLLAACSSAPQTRPWMAQSGSQTASGQVPSEIIVQRGDTVHGIARRYGVEARAIIERNNLQPPYTLEVGQRLLMPRPRVHVVVRRDTLSEIAVAYRVDMHQLARVNQLGPPYLIRVGQVLFLPDSAAAPTVMASAPPASPRQTSQTSSPQATSSPPPSAAPAPPPRASGRFAWPVQGEVLSTFGQVRPGQRNDGINIAVPAGTPVRAAENGVVVYAGNELRGFGNQLLIKHDDDWITAYAHNERLEVNRGDTVQRGQIIARVGQTGNVDRPQLHFEVRQGSRPVDPLPHMEQAMASR